MFTPLTTSLGAFLLHLSSTTLLSSNSQILGCSSLLCSPLSAPSLTSTPTLLGLFLSPLLLPFLPSPSYPTVTLATTITAGLLVGVGTKLAKGCTSGHLLLGVARGSMRSIVATATFFTTAVITAAIANSPPTCAGGPCYTMAEPTAAVAWGGLGIPLLLAFSVAGSVAARFLPATESSRVAIRFFSGLVFGGGLLLSGMASPEKTLGFMSIRDFSRFDPSLFLVALIALGGNAIAWRMRGEGPALICGSGWKVPSGKVEWRLIVGSAVFGVGWGLLGVCPGPGTIAIIKNGGAGLAWAGAFLAGRVVGSFV